MSTPSGQVREYCKTIVERFGGGWNRFWFAPSDPAPLAAVRIATGCLAFYWLATYSFDLVSFFGPLGIVPVGLQNTLAGEPAGAQIFPPSYLNYVNSPGQLWAVHLAGMAVVAAFTLGLFTRVTAVLSLGVILSYIHRGPVLTGQFEPIMAMAMFYLCLGPCGARFSLDAWRKRRRLAQIQTVAKQDPVAPTTAATISLRLIQVHLCLIYLMMGIAKVADPTEVWWLGEAMWWLAARPDSPLIDFSWLAAHPYVVNAWTHGQVIFELTFALLIWNRLARPLLLVWAIVMWGLAALVTGWTLFCLMLLAANLAYVSPRFLLAFSRSGESAASSPAGKTPATV